MLIRADIVFIFFELFLIVPFVIHAELSTRSAASRYGSCWADRTQGRSGSGWCWRES